MHAPDRAPRAPDSAAWSLPLAVLLGSWLWFAFSSGGYVERQWLPPALTIAFFAVVVFASVAYPRRPGQLGMTALSLFAAYAVWLVISAAWAPSITAAWEEANRTCVYTLVFCLALCFLTDGRARRAARYLLLAAASTLLGLIAWHMHRAGALGGIDALFAGGGLSYPLSYTNGLAALCLMLLWPMLAIAADPHERAAARGLALGVCWGLTTMGLLTRSSGGFWSLAAVFALTLLLSPCRLRTLAFCLTPLVLTLWAYPDLSAYWSQGPAATGEGVVLRVLVVGGLIATVVGVALAMLERWVRVTWRMRAAFLVGFVILLSILAIYGVSLSDRGFDEGLRDLRAGFSDVVDERTDIWTVAWHDVGREPLRGIGAGGFVFRYNEMRDTGTFDVRLPHSTGLGVLTETGGVGAALFFGSLVVGLGGTLWPRFASAWCRLRGRDGRWGTDPRAYAWSFSLAMAVVYWLIHGSIDWLYHIPAVSVPAILMLAVGIAHVDGLVDPLWPRVPRVLGTLKQVMPFLTPPVIVMMRRRRRSHASTSHDVRPAARPDEERPPVATTPTARRDPWLSPYRRAARYEARRRRTTEKNMRRRRHRAALVPVGPLSTWFRRVGLATSVTVTLALLAPYLSSQCEQAAVRSRGEDLERSLGYAGIAARLQPGDPRPLLVEADTYLGAALAAAGGPLDRADATSVSAVLDNLSLALDAHVRAIERDPAEWSLHFLAGNATIRLLAAKTGETQGLPAVGDMEPSTIVAGDVALAQDPFSLANTADRRSIADAYRGLSPAELRLLAASYYTAARTRNPLNPRVAGALAAVAEGALR